MSSKWKGFFGEAVRAVVESNKRKIRDGKTNYYLNQKKQLWYTMMYAMDGLDENDPRNKQPRETTHSEQ